MRIFHTEKFEDNIANLPLGIKRIYKKQEDIFFINWKDPRLHTKKLKGDKNIFSFRITRQYRVLFILLEENSSLFISVGHRKDIYE